MNETFTLLLGAMFFLALYIWGVRDLEKWDKRAKYAQALLTLLALLTTGYWFFLERRGMPHADVSQEVSVIPVTEGLVAVEAHVEISNLGQRLLRIDKVSSRLQLVRHERFDYDDLATKMKEDYWQAVRPRMKAENSKQFHYAELRWPIYRKYEDEVEHRIEPGETDVFVVTYLASCKLAKWVRVATDVHKPEKARLLFWNNDGQKDETGRKAFVYAARTFVNIAEVCNSNGG